MGHTLRIEPAGLDLDINDNETVLAAARRQGWLLPHICQGGTCGSCRAELLAGQVDMGTQRPPALSEADEARGEVLLCQARALTDVTVKVESREAGAITVRTLPCRVLEMKLLARDVMRVVLKTPEQQSIEYLPGQYIDFLLRDNKRRSFSIANAPGRGEGLELHIRRVEGGYFTGHVFEAMKEKDLLRIQGPLGGFYWHPHEGPVLMVAGGTGMAPIKSILEDVLPQKTTQTIHVYWGVRKQEDLYFDETLKRWQQDYPNFRYTPVLSRTTAEDHWPGRQGYVNDAVIEDIGDLSHHAVYACGPPAMVSALRQQGLKQGLQDSLFFSDAFEFAKDG